MSAYNDLELTQSEIKSLVENPYALVQVIYYHEQVILEIDSVFDDLHKNSILEYHQARIEFIKDKIKSLMFDYGIESFKELGL